MGIGWVVVEGGKIAKQTARRHNHAGRERERESERVCTCVCTHIRKYDARHVVLEGK